ncbi:MAG: hypothetical protein ABIF10_07305 [Candidatus Woesearchaeota archaeon]
MDKFNINDKVLVILKEQGYFDPWDGAREVSIVPQSRMEERLGISNMPDRYKTEKIREKGILGIKAFAGVYVGDRHKVMKIQPLYGIEHPESEYFILKEDQIETISHYTLEK